MHSTLSPADAKRITFFYERWRALGGGLLETASTTFLLLIALRHYHADSISKAIVAGGGSAGLLLSPLLVYISGKLHWRAATAATWLSVIGAVGFLLAALLPWLPGFVTGSVLGMICLAMTIPMQTQISQDNYPVSERGYLFSRTVVLRILAAAVFSELIARALTDHFNRFPLLMLAYAGAMLASAYCFSRCPSRIIPTEEGISPLQGLRVLKEDPQFRTTLIAWMFMGFANLMMLALRVEYLGNPVYGLTLTTGMIALMTSILPNIARMVMSPVWGKLFDRMNFFTLRIVLNIGFAIGIVTFYTGNSLPGLITGALIFGVSVAGGDVAWSLWVTKFAPPERVAEYMAVHTCLTGLRGIIAPLVGFLLLSHYSVHIMALFSGALILISCVILWPERKVARPNPHAAPLTEDVTD